MKTDENNPEDWYRSAKVRLGSADRLYPLEGMSESVIELLQESAERYLKGYLHFQAVGFISHSRLGCIDR